MPNEFSLIFSFPILFIIGLGAGSFINVLSIRYDPDRSMFGQGSFFGRSHCQTCGRTLLWYELIPLASFVFLRGKCRTCRAPLSWQYPIVELVTGLLFAFIPAHIAAFYPQIPHLGFENSSVIPIFSVLWLLAAAALICIAVIDFHHKIIPDELNISIFVLGLGAIAAKYFLSVFGPIEGSLLGHSALIFGGRSNLFFNHALAAASGALFFAAVIAVSRGRAMGVGDAKLAGALGTFMGWPDVVFALALSFIIGSLVSIVLLLRRKKSLKDAVPFAPFIVAGVFCTLFFGKGMFEAYLTMFSF